MQIYGIDTCGVMLKKIPFISGKTVVAHLIKFGHLEALVFVKSTAYYMPWHMMQIMRKQLFSLIILQEMVSGKLQASKHSLLNDDEMKLW